MNDSELKNHRCVLGEHLHERRYSFLGNLQPEERFNVGQQSFYDEKGFQKTKLHIPNHDINML
jgi:hypothetical protein